MAATRVAARAWRGSARSSASRPRRTRRARRADRLLTADRGGARRSSRWPPSSACTGCSSTAPTAGRWSLQAVRRPRRRGPPPPRPGAPARRPPLATAAAAPPGPHLDPLPRHHRVAAVPTGRHAPGRGRRLRAAWRCSARCEAPAPVETGFLAASRRRHLGHRVRGRLGRVPGVGHVRGRCCRRRRCSCSPPRSAATGQPGGERRAVRGRRDAVRAPPPHRDAGAHVAAGRAATARQGRWSLLGTGVAHRRRGGRRRRRRRARSCREPTPTPMVAWRDINDGRPTRVVLSPMVVAADQDRSTSRTSSCSPCAASAARTGA